MYLMAEVQEPNQRHSAVVINKAYKINVHLKHAKKGVRGCRDYYSTIVPRTFSDVKLPFGPKRVCWMRTQGCTKRLVAAVGLVFQYLTRTQQPFAVLSPVSARKLELSSQNFKGVMPTFSQGSIAEGPLASSTYTFAI